MNNQAYLAVRCGGEKNYPEFSSGFDSPGKRSRVGKDNRKKW